jgi:hypothetical protein
VRRWTAALVVLAVLPLASCSDGTGPREYDLTLEGTARVGDRLLREGRHHLQVGQTVTVTSGSGVLTLPRRSSVELRAGRRGARDARLRVAAAPVLIDGEALVVGQVRLHIGVARFDVDGAGRAGRSSGGTFAVYEGRARVRALERELLTPAYRQVAVTDTGTLPRRPMPLVFHRADLDPWDRAYLGDVIDLGDQLDRHSRALDVELAPPTPPDPAYLRRVVPALRRVASLPADLVNARRSVGETVVGASIALSGPGTFAGRWSAAVRFRGQGADWGLVAADQRARRAALFGVLDNVLDSVPSRFAAPAAVPSTTAPTRASRGARPSTTSTTTPAPVPSVTLPPVSVPLGPSSSPPPTTPAPTPTTIPPTTLPPPPTIPPPTVPPPTIPEPLQGLLEDLLNRGRNRNASPGLLGRDDRDERGRDGRRGGWRARGDEGPTRD